MPNILIDAALKEKLIAAGQAVTFVDESGAKLGRFNPSLALFGYDDLDLTPEQLEHALSPECKTYSTQEVLAYCKGRV